MKRACELPACRRMVLAALILWVVGGALFLAGIRRGADFALGAALVLLVVAIIPFPTLRRSKPPSGKM